MYEFYTRGNVCMRVAEVAVRSERTPWCGLSGLGREFRYFLFWYEAFIGASRREQPHRPLTRRTPMATESVG